VDVLVAVGSVADPVLGAAVGETAMIVALEAAAVPFAMSVVSFVPVVAFPALAALPVPER
jgi:ABC-type methionine transport system permease subunit